MILVRIEAVSANTGRVKTVATLEIQNVEHRATEFGRYLCDLRSPDGEQSTRWMVEGHDRSLGAVELVRKAIGGMPR